MAKAKPNQNNHCRGGGDGYFLEYFLESEAHSGRLKFNFVFWTGGTGIHTSYFISTALLVYTEIQIKAQRKDVPAV